MVAMLTRDRSLVVIVGLVGVGAIAVGLSATGAVGNPDGVGALRVLLVVCAIAVFGVAAAYRSSRDPGQATGHAIAGVGFFVAAAVGTGPGVWIGVGLACVGCVLLVRDAVRRRRTSRSST